MSRSRDWPGVPAAEPAWSGEVEDLSTFGARRHGGLPADALAVAPPEAFWIPLAGPVPGRLTAGSLPPECWARYLLRLPARWNGRLVVAGSPGPASERGYDLYWSDFLLMRGYAFACMDKGLRLARGVGGHWTPDGEKSRLRHWTRRMRELVEYAQAETAAHYGRPAERIYAVGVSNGGYLVRRLLEETSGLVAGGVEVSGVLWRPDGGLCAQLPAALAAWGATERPLSEAGRKALWALGLAAEPVWDPVLAFYRAHYWEPTLALFVGDFDPGYRGALAEYDFSTRSAAVRGCAAEAANTGRIDAPLISLAGGHDFLISAANHAHPYGDLVAAAGRGRLHSMVLVEDATHVDSDRALFPAAAPLMPRAHEAFLSLVERVEGRG